MCEPPTGPTTDRRVDPSDVNDLDDGVPLGGGGFHIFHGQPARVIDAVSQQKYDRPRLARLHELERGERRVAPRRHGARGHRAQRGRNPLSIGGVVHLAMERLGERHQGNPIRGMEPRDECRGRGSEQRQALAIETAAGVEQRTNAKRCIAHRDQVDPLRRPVVRHYKVGRAPASHGLPPFSHTHIEAHTLGPSRPRTNRLRRLP